MGRTFYSADATPAVPGLPEATRADHLLETTEPLAASHAALQPGAPVVVNPAGRQIASTPALEALAARIRTAVVDTYEDVSEKVDYYSSVAVSHWGMTVDRTKSIVSSEDQFLPNSLYVLSAALAGSIITRNRGLPTRFLTPWVFSAVALNLAMPHTYANIAGSLADKYQQVEAAKVPELTKARLEAVEGVRQLSESTSAQTDVAWESLVSTVHNSREAITSAIYGRS